MTWRDDSAVETLPFTPTGEGRLYAPTEQSSKGRKNSTFTYKYTENLYKV